jgi:hypothetical protein
VRSKLERGGLIELVGRENFFDNLADAIEASRPPPGDESPTTTVGRQTVLSDTAQAVLRTTRQFFSQPPPDS